MNGSNDEQHDAHVKCYRIAVAVAAGDAVEAAYGKHLEKAGSTDERDAAYRAYVERPAARGKTRRRPPPELLLAPGRILVQHQPDPGREIASRPKHRRIRRHDRGRPQNPDARDGLNPSAHLVRTVLRCDLGLGSSVKLDFEPLFYQLWYGNRSLKMAAPATDRTLTDLGESIGQLLKLLLLTGCRRTELAGMLWSEIGAGGTWVIPGSRTKNWRAHVVPLPPLAHNILASIKPIASAYAFTTTWSKIKEKLDAAMGNPAPWRLRDLRRTFVTGLADLGIRPDVIELAVNHRSGARGHIAGVYNRSVLPERNAALETWANRVGRLVVGKSAKVFAGPGLRK